MSPILSLRPLQTQSDAKLVAMARDGHERAFEALVRRYRRQLLAYANRLLGAEGRAEDALQHALLQAWIALRADADVRDVRAWLYRIVHNSAVSTLRRPRHETVELNEALDASASDDGPESRVLVDEILTSLAALPDLQRRAMVMTAIRGDSHGEAAATLGLTDGAVRGLIYRARTTMRDAAAALMPFGVFNWVTGLGNRRGPGAANTSDVLGAAGGAGSAGLAAAVLKGGAVIATAGALATAGHFAIPKVFSTSRPNHSPALVLHPASARQHASSSATEASDVSRPTALTSVSPALGRTGGRREARSHDQSAQASSGRGGSPASSGRSGSGDHGNSGNATGTGPGGPSRGGDLSSHDGSTTTGAGSRGSTSGSGDGGGGGGRGEGGSTQSSGDGSHGGEATSLVGSSSGSGHDSSSSTSTSLGGSHDGGSTDAGGSTSTVATPVEVSGADSGQSAGDLGGGSSGTDTGSSTDPGSSSGSDGSSH
jgi:RNA polymerase sigma factor (sigma-70 family)